MATTEIPVTVEVKVTSQLDPGVTLDPRTFSTLLAAKPYGQFRYDLSGSGSKALDVPANAKMVLVVYEQGTAALVIDLGTDTITLHQGGMFLIVDPAATTTPSVTLTHTAAAVVRGTLFG